MMVAFRNIGRLLLSGAAAGLLLLAAAAAAVAALYSPTAFRLLEFHPLALRVVDGVLGGSDLRLVRLHGLMFDEREILHLLDVKRMVAFVRVALPVVLACLALLLALRPALARPATAGALGLYFGLLLLPATGALVFGAAPTSDALHGLLFAPGSFVFPVRSLTATLYGNAIVLKGSAFVAGLTLGFLVAAWAAARLLRRPRLLEAANRKSRPAGTRRKRTTDP